MSEQFKYDILYADIKHNLDNYTQVRGLQCTFFNIEHFYSRDLVILDNICAVKGGSTVMSMAIHKNSIIDRRKIALFRSVMLNDCKKYFTEAAYEKLLQNYEIRIDGPTIIVKFDNESNMVFDYLGSSFVFKCEGIEFFVSRKANSEFICNMYMALHTYRLAKRVCITNVYMLLALMKQSGVPTPLRKKIYCLIHEVDFDELLKNGNKKDWWNNPELDI